MKVIETNRLILRQLHTGDAAFILSLLNDPSWLKYIGDKGVKSLQDAEKYILTGPVDMYQRLGFGLWLVELKSDQKPVGLCGLIKRDTHIHRGHSQIPKPDNHSEHTQHRHSVPHYPRPSVISVPSPQTLANAMTEAKRANKRVLVHLGAPW